MALCNFGNFYIAHFLMHSITVHARVLIFHIWIPHEKIADTYFFSYQNSELWPFEKIWMESCQQTVSKTIEARALKFEEWVGSDE